MRGEKRSVLKTKRAETTDGRQLRFVILGMVGSGIDRHGVALSLSIGDVGCGIVVGWGQS